MYIMYILNVSVSVNELILSFLLLFSVLVYHEYTNFNIGWFLVEWGLNQITSLVPSNPIANYISMTTS